MTQTQIATYRAALKEARADFTRAKARLKSLSEESYAVMDEIARLRRTITALAAMCSEEPNIDNLGITEACTEVMQFHEQALTTADVVDKLGEMGFDTESQKNISASVHAILTRLATKGVIRREVDKQTRTVMWHGPNYDPLRVLVEKKS